ncbi:MAG: hypothetical protein AABX11_03290 [Nanoarchaeota archaeon]
MNYLPPPTFKEFNPNDFAYLGGLMIERKFWIALSPETTLKSEGFYIPSKKLNPNWPEILELKYGLTPNVKYDLKLMSLPSEITREMQEKLKQRRNLIAKKLYIPVSNELPSPEECLLDIQTRIRAKQSAKELTRLLETSQEEPKELTEFERKVLQWNPEIGILKSRTQFNINPKRPKLEYEVVNEYLFHLSNSPITEISYFEGILLNLCQEPNTNRAIFGFRRDMATDWPNSFPKEFIDEMNTLIHNLENILK